MIVWSVKNANASLRMNWVMINIVLSVHVLLRFTDSDYPFGIFELFWWPWTLNAICFNITIILCVLFGNQVFSNNTKYQIQQCYNIKLYRYSSPQTRCFSNNCTRKLTSTSYTMRPWRLNIIEWSFYMVTVYCELYLLK